ncbi:MAG: DUF411 domain-containing protein [Gemmatimonadaceae bacterium]
MQDRRNFLRVAIGGLLGIVALPRDMWGGERGSSQPTNTRRRMTIYKSPTCECCKKWVEHVRQLGWIIDVKDVEDVDKIKDRVRVPKSVRSCHTAIVGRTIFEGHVPADLIETFMGRSRGVAGLAVPGMPIGTPGMEVPGQPAERYQILGFYPNGRTFVYASR